MPSTDTSARRNLRFVEAAEPIRQPITKFGGQPVWLEDPLWPLSASTGRPMRFLGQVRLPGEEIRLGYLFLTDDLSDDEFVEGTWDPRAGENAFFAQPGRPADFYQVASIRTGPTFGPDHHVELTPYEDEPVEPGAEDLRSRVWGAPEWLQNEEPPDEPGAWRFVLQLDSTDDLPFYVNFGDAGVGYAFIDDNTGEGRFLWQCS